MIRKALIAVIAIALLVPQTGAAAYSLFPGQSLKVEKIDLTPAQATLNMGAVVSVSPAMLGVSIFGKTYTVNIGGATILNANGLVMSAGQIAVGNLVNVAGRWNESSALTINAQAVRVVSGGPSGPGPTPPPGDGGGGGGGPQQPENDLTLAVRALHAYAATGVEQAEVPAVQRLRWRHANLDTWNTFGGSQNYSPVAEAAAGNYEWLADLARLEREEGLMSKEIGSPAFYFSLPVVSKMVALKAAREAGDTAAANELAANLKAIWTFWSLVAVPGGRTSATGNFAGQTFSGPGSSDKFSGAVVAVAGERWNATLPPRWLEGDDVSVLLAWALDLPRSAAATANKDLLTSGNWWDSIVAQVTGVGQFAAATPAEAWGLTAADRAALRRIVQGDASGLDAALATLRDYGGVWQSYIFRMRRTTQGVETVFFRSANGNKPAHAATSVTNAGAWRTMRPCSGNASGANKGFLVWIADGTINAVGDPARCRLVSQPELGGDVVYSVVIRGKSVTRGNVVSSQPTPPGDVAPPPPTGGGGGLEGPIVPDNQDEEPPADFSF